MSTDNNKPVHRELTDDEQSEIVGAFK